MPTKPIFSIWFLTILVLALRFPSPDLPSLFTFIPDGKLNTNYQLINNTQSNSPTQTIVFNLPIIEQNSPTSTPIPMEIYPAPEIEVDITPGTPTPTPIPVQTGSVNLPIVFGALGIMFVIILAWFFVGYLPGRKNKPS
jgi:hypothetical protein